MQLSKNLSVKRSIPQGKFFLDQGNPRFRLFITNTPRANLNIVLIAEGLGFFVLLFITWLDEGIALPRNWLGSWFGPGTLHEAILESIAIIVIGLMVILYTNYILKKLHYLESFLRVCAWCRKLDLNGKWMPMEEYLQRASNIDCTHGICEECAAKVKIELSGESESITSPAVESSNHHLHNIKKENKPQRGFHIDEAT